MTIKASDVLLKLANAITKMLDDSDVYISPATRDALVVLHIVALEAHDDAVVEECKE